jgi:hypothetical protein
MHRRVSALRLFRKRASLFLKRLRNSFGTGDTGEALCANTEAVMYRRREWFRIRKSMFFVEPEIVEHPSAPDTPEDHFLLEIEVMIALDVTEESKASNQKELDRLRRTIRYQRLRNMKY